MEDSPDGNCQASPRSVRVWHALEQIFRGSFIRYDGSIATPPCTEGIHYFVADQTIAISPETLDTIHDSLPPNNRVVQERNDRCVVKGVADLDDFCSDGPPSSHLQIPSEDDFDDEPNHGSDNSFTRFDDNLHSGSRNDSFSSGSSDELDLHPAGLAANRVQNTGTHRNAVKNATTSSGLKSNAASSNVDDLQAEAILEFARALNRGEDKEEAYQREQQRFRTAYNNNARNNNAGAATKQQQPKNQQRMPTQGHQIPRQQLANTNLNNNNNNNNNAAQRGRTQYYRAVKPLSQQQSQPQLHPAPANEVQPVQQQHRPHPPQTPVHQQQHVSEPLTPGVGQGPPVAPSIEELVRQQVARAMNVQQPPPPQQPPPATPQQREQMISPGHDHSHGGVDATGDGETLALGELQNPIAQNAEPLTIAPGYPPAPVPDKKPSTVEDAAAQVANAIADDTKHSIDLNNVDLNDPVAVQAAIDRAANSNVGDSSDDGAAMQMPPFEITTASTTTTATPAPRHIMNPDNGQFADTLGTYKGIDMNPNGDVPHINVPAHQSNDLLGSAQINDVNSQASSGQAGQGSDG